MPNYSTPGIYIEEVATGNRPIEARGTGVAAFLGQAPRANARLHEPVVIDNWTQFVKVFAGEGARTTPLAQAVFGFFENSGRRCFVINVGEEGNIAGTISQGRRQGVAVLEEVDQVSIVAAPGLTGAANYDALIQHCEKQQDRVAILDPPEEVTDLSLLTRVVTAEVPGGRPSEEGAGLRPPTIDRGSATFYFPYITTRNVFQPSQLINVPPSGHIAGIWARTDAFRGVHKAPANESVRGALNVTYRVTDTEQGELNQNGVNCIRYFSTEGIRVWGARTLAPSASEWRYLNVRRFFIMVEQSIKRGTRWVVFEPNDLTLWKSIRRDISAFLLRMWRDGALMGRTPDEAFFVKCDEETNPPEVVDAGQVITVIGLAPVKPAEFVVFRITQAQAQPSATEEA